MIAVLLRHLCRGLVPRRLAPLGEQDQGCGICGLRGEGEVQENEWIRIRVGNDRDRVEDDPKHDDDGLADDVLRRSEEAGGALGPLTESVLPEGAVPLLHGVEATASGGHRRELVLAEVAERLERTAVNVRRAALANDARSGPV